MDDSASSGRAAPRWQLPSAVGKNGLNPRKLISIPSYIYGLNVSPDGERILFVWSHNGTNLLQEIAADGTGLRTILKPVFVNYPKENPQGFVAAKRFYFVV
jgi:hypothetical protein